MGMSLWEEVNTSFYWFVPNLIKNIYSEGPWYLLSGV